MNKMESAVLLNISEDDFTCKLCMDLMLKPKILHCGHRICDFCVNYMIASEMKLSCPYCRESIEYTPKTDLFQKKIIEQIENKVTCGEKVLGSLYDQHKKKCLECLHNEYEKSEQLTALFLTNKSKKEEKIRQFLAMNNQQSEFFPILY